MSAWGFYGRTDELRALTSIIARGRWFFVRITGRRRIGKTTLLQRGLQQKQGAAVFYAEAENWFLSELRGRYDVVLKYVASHPGCTNGDMESYVREVSPDTAEQVGGYLRILIDKYGMLERRLPILSKQNVRRGRYYLKDNFLRSWLSALAAQVSAVNFLPVESLIEVADSRLIESEGHGLERMVAALYEERSRNRVGDFELSQRVQGFWHRSDVEIDLIAISETDRRIRFGTCKRNPEKLMGSIPSLHAHVSRFLDVHRQFKNYRHEFVAFAPRIESQARTELQSRGMIPQDLADLTRWHGA